MAIDTEYKPEFVAGELQVWRDQFGLLTITTPGRSIPVGDTDTWKAGLRYIVRLMDLDDEALARGE